MMEKHSIFKATTLYTIKAELLTIDQYIDSRITSLNPHTLLNNGDYVDIVITGFNYYSSYWNNPSGELARALDGSIINSYRVKGFVPTVSLKNAVSRMKEILSTTKPKLVIGMGLNPATRFVDIELVSVNQTYFTQPDVDGNIVRLQKILDTGPQIAYSTLPLEGIMRECSEKKSLPIKPSVSIGLYLCNVVAYMIMTYGVEKKIPAGFIHLPPTTINLLRRETEHGIPFSEILEAVKCIIEDSTSGMYDH
jgi:pyroglutamyl-peptidase